MSKQRVVVTGVGMLSPLGLSAEESWQNALAGRSGISTITRFDTTGFDVTIAGEIKNFNPDLFIEKKEQKKMDLFIQYAVAASKMAAQDANITITDDISEKAGCFIGSGIGGLTFLEEQVIKMKERGPSRLSPFFIPSVISNLASGHVSILFNLKGPNYSVTSACASGAHAIGEAVRYIRDGICDVMFAGGTEGAVCAAGIGGFAAMKALSTRNAEPEKASRPWDKDRDGFVLAEGAAILILESLEHAKKRGARILCEITGYGVSSDAYHMTSPPPGGEGGARAMKMALKDAGLQPTQIDYINAHGTSTPVGDGLETAALKSVFGDHARNLKVSSTKSMTGHTLGAAGAIESVFCIYAIRDQKIAPTINLENPSDDCDLNYVALKAIDSPIQHAVNNSFGFGGTNACVIFSKWSE